MNKSQKANATIKTIVIILFLLLLLRLTVPVFFNTTHDYSYIVKQRAQFHAIRTALELFESDFKKYPPSDGLDPNGIPYCGAMKLAEAMVGQDLMGCHPKSIFRSDGKDSLGILLYDPSTMSVRKGPYLPIENANAYTISEFCDNYGEQDFIGDSFILCDVFNKVRNKKTGEKIGMPILYYKADTTKGSHDVNNPDNPDNIYNYKDNYDLLALGVPGKPGVKHPLYEDTSLFYIMTQNTNAKTSEPFNKDSYILISAGKDGLFGTSDDITNFDFKWRPKK